MMRAIAIIAVLLLAGCDIVPPDAPDYSAGIAVACGVAAAAPADSPAPLPDDEVCRSCGGTGWLGDGVIKEDCPDCDTPWKQLPPESPSPERQVIPLDAEAPSTAKPAQEVNVWYSNYEAAGKVALETGRPLIVAVTAEKPDYEPTAGTVFCWLDSAIHAHEWEPFNPPCLLLCERVTSAPPEFTPTTLEAL